MLLCVVKSDQQTEHSSFNARRRRMELVLFFVAYNQPVRKQFALCSLLLLFAKMLGVKRVKFDLGDAAAKVTTFF